ncbi:SMP-30/gluconolactonase/LRE family protein [Nocardia sp. NPDC051030]|uniref:SMP-30/gluconolactonase/LRE family protein n=1 Tax=Nocardia sp. NPDC051030 TaxID=3155162 RepID=UPI003439B67F
MTASMGVALTAFAGAGHAAPAGADQCGVWTASQVASGYGMLESLGFDGRGGMLLSEQAVSGTGGGIRRLGAEGERSTVLADVNGAGKISIVGDTAFFTTGLSLQAKFSGSPGGIQSVDLDSGAVRTIAGGLRVPNGLAQLPDGDFVVTSDMGDDTRLMRVRGGVSAGPYSSAVTSTNGIAYDAARQRLYVSTTFDSVTVLAMVDTARPEEPTRFELPGFGPLNAADGLTIGPDGKVYIAFSVGGKVVRVDPDAGRWCTVAENLPLSTGVQFGSGPGWDRNSLYVSSYLGTVTRLTPR